jgi:hypothetical protein
MDRKQKRKESKRSEDSVGKDEGKQYLKNMPTASSSFAFPR